MLPILARAIYKEFVIYYLYLDDIGAINFYHD